MEAASTGSGTWRRTEVGSRSLLGERVRGAMTTSDTDRFGALSLLGFALAAGVLMLAAAVTAKPAEAAFPGANGKIAFTSDRVTLANPTGDREIFTMNPNGTGVTQLTDNTEPDYSPAFSADGTRIAFVSQRDVNAEI